MKNNVFGKWITHDTEKCWWLHVFHKSHGDRQSIQRYQLSTCLKPCPWSIVLSLDGNSWSQSKISPRTSRRISRSSKRKIPPPLSNFLKQSTDKLTVRKIMLVDHVKLMKDVCTTAMKPTRPRPQHLICLELIQTTHQFHILLQHRSGWARLPHS